jgi:hypothetical protein
VLRMHAPAGVFLNFHDDRHISACRFFESPLFGR